MLTHVSVIGLSCWLHIDKQIWSLSITIAPLWRTVARWWCWWGDWESWRGRFVLWTTQGCGVLERCCCCCCFDLWPHLHPNKSLPLPVKPITLCCVHLIHPARVFSFFFLCSFSKQNVALARSLTHFFVINVPLYAHAHR